MANIEENPTVSVEETIVSEETKEKLEAALHEEPKNMAEAADQATCSVGTKPGELIAKHKAEIDKINEQMKKLAEQGKELQDQIEKTKQSMLNLGTIRAERVGAIKGLQELIEKCLNKC